KKDFSGAAVDSNKIFSASLKDTVKNELTSFALVKDLTNKKIQQENPELTGISRPGKDLERNNSLLNSIRYVQKLYIDNTKKEEIFSLLLDIFVKMTESEYGFIDEVLIKDKGVCCSRNLANSNAFMEKAFESFKNKFGANKLLFIRPGNHTGIPVVTGDIFIDNQMQKVIKSTNNPPGHPQIKTFMAIPLFAGGAVVGVAGVVNRKEGYNSGIAYFLQPLTSACSSIIHAYKKEKEQKKYLNLIKYERDQLLSIFNSMDEVVYISDPDSYEMLFMNKAAVDLWGNYSGKKCYSVLQNRDKPCPFCTNKLIFGPNIGKTHIWEFCNEVTHQWFRCIDRAIKWNSGKNVRFEIAVNINDLKRTHEWLQKSETRFRFLAENVRDVIFKINLRPFIKADFINHAIEDMLGYKMQDFISDRQILKKVVHKDYYYTFLKMLTGKIDYSSPLVLKFIHKDSRALWVELKLTPLYEKNKIVSITGIMRDITEKIDFEKKLEYLSFHDSLTGLFNRAYSETELERLDTQRQLPISIIIADLNGLKLINDAFGHKNGDRLLKKTAIILKTSCRKEDIISRWGGDEFLILLPKTSGKRAAEIIAKIQEKCKATARLKLPLSISLGASTKKEVLTDMRIVLKEAEDNMYKQKLLESAVIQKAIVDSLTIALYEKNINAKRHYLRVMEFSVKLARKLNLSAARLEILKLYAKRHDIGKVAIKEKLINKKKIAEKEFSIIKKHPEIGYRLAKSTSTMAPIAEYILSHHEWWNGGGYPRGLKGKEIPLISRIVAIADAYDTMINEKSYGRVKSKPEAIEELKKYSGIQFDPELLKKFIPLIAGKKIPVKT
ncbi:MAG: diguanylate cyclase, partial [Actinobacteria bacterium]|nr:diguanylate cyclase [Actinomycetota bacterium]